MTTTDTPLLAGARMPRLDLVDTTGTAVAPATDGAQGTVVVYFMRTSTCPVCHQHLRLLERLAPAGAADRGEILIVVPGGPREAASVARRHPALAAAITASDTAHAAMGLFVRAGLQQSGTYVVANGLITHARYATVPLGSFDEAAARATLG